jgi:hypothetical protein
MKTWRDLGWSAILLALFVALITWGTWQFFTRPLPGGNDFLTHYGAWEAYWREGVSPYSDAAAAHTQRAIYGRPALPGEDQNRMVYPFYSIVLHGPFVLIQDYPLARALYMTLSQIALFAGVVLCLRVLRWQPPIGLLAFVLAWSLLYYHEARGVIIGQFAIIAFGAWAATLYFLSRKQDARAGAIFVLTTVKPTLVFLVAPFLLLWGIARRRWNFVAGFGATWLVLMIGSFILLPTWLGDWLKRVLLYSGYTHNQCPVWTIAQLGLLITAIYVGALSGLLLWSWRRAWQTDDAREWFWTLGLTLIVSNLISPRAATTDYVLMLAPTLGLFAALDRTPRWGRGALIVLLIVSLFGLWGLHLATVQGNWEQAAMFLPWPLALGLAWLVGRRWLFERWEDWPGAR